MKLSRKWLNEFVDLPLSECGDRQYAEAMSVSGSKVEATEDLSASMRNVKAGRIISLEKHPDSDHLLVVRLDVGAPEPLQICTGAWNVHVGDLVPVALHNSVLPGGVKIGRGKFRGVASDGMLCSLKDLGLSTHDFPYAVIKAAAILRDYRPIDPAKPSISPDIQPGDKIFGKTIAARALKLENAGVNLWRVSLDPPAETVTSCRNIHEGDLLAYNSETNEILSPAELRAKPEEFPHCVEDGIFIIHEDLLPGADICEFLGRDDHVVEFEITPNRPDCLCVIGLARETAVTFGKELKLHSPCVRAGAGGDINEHAKIIIENPELCPRYTARMVKNVKIAPSPAWMCRRLRNSGMRPINNIVDITNYVMLEYGQPMHAFDFSCVKGGEIHIRRAAPGETIRTLDGNERSLSPNMLCICDVEKPVGVAGVMGGENSEIVGDTAMVLLESANFSGPSIRRTATALGMRTDASSRFEKGLDINNTLQAIQRACELIELLGVGEVVDGVIDVIPNEISRTVLPLEPDKINALLGTDISGEYMRHTLSSLGFTFEGDLVHVPSWRSDVEHYSDIAEEVARFYGYNEIPTCFTGTVNTCGGYSPLQQCERTIGASLRALGLSEIITYSFISPYYYDKIRLPEDSPLRDSLRILNPLGEDRSIMRRSILPSMLDILSRNYNFRNKSTALYEIGRIYHKRPDGLADEPRIVSLGLYGEGVDFFSLKGIVEELLSVLRCPLPEFTAVKDNPSYHPGRCAALSAGGRHVGVLGQIHPEVALDYGVDTELYCAELSFDLLFELRGDTPVYCPLPRFPSVTRDLALVCDASLPAGDLQRCVMSSCCDFLKSCEVFDVYTGSNIAEGKKSVAFTLTMRADDRNLEDKDAEAVVSRVLTALKENFDADLR